jgi:Tfp pilus assembly protein PilX
MLRQRKKSAPRRFGFASVLAMLFLVLFATLAVGFCAATSLSAQVGKNEQSLSVSQVSAESGLQFMRYQLGIMTIPPLTTNSQLLTTVYGLLSASLNGTPNMGTDTVALVNNKIYIPGNSSHYVTLDQSMGLKFQAVVEQVGDKLVCTVNGAGSDSGVQRGVQLKFKNAPRASAVFNYGVASKGKIVTGGTATIIGSPDPTMGSILSTSSDANPVVIGGPQVSGDISITNSTGTVSTGSASIGGTSDPAKVPSHIHKGVASPVFPSVDSTVYTTAVTMNPYVAGAKTLSNVTIPPNTNPTFGGNTFVNGVLLIQAPNNVTFSGNTYITGVIVTDNSVPFNATANTITFAGAVKAVGVQGLPDNSTYTNLRSLTGAFVLAPGFNVSFTGNFGTIAGTIIGGEVSMTGSAGGTIQGSVIATENQALTVNGSAGVTIAGTGTSNYPSGVTFGSYYSPLPDTYMEIIPQ